MLIYASMYLKIIIAPYRFSKQKYLFRNASLTIKVERRKF